MHDAKILLLGKSGQVGRELSGRLALLGKVVSCNRNECDLADLDILRKTLIETSPEIIVNAAAYTSVDRAEVEPDRAELVNSKAVEVIAEHARSTGATFVHYSTDYVFDGTLQRAYREDDATHPLSAYGRSKLQGEEAILLSGCRHLIFRTSWIHSSFGGNFLKTILRLMTTRESLSVVDDEWGAPTSAALVADVTLLAIRDRLSGLSLLDDGVYHLAAAGCTNWYMYACHIAERASLLGFELRVAPSDIHPISSELYPTAAVRPKNSQLDSSLLNHALDVVLPDWRAGVNATLDSIAIGNCFTAYMERG